MLMGDIEKFKNAFGREKQKKTSITITSMGQVQSVLKAGSGKN